MYGRPATELSGPASPAQSSSHVHASISVAAMRASLNEAQQSLGEIGEVLSHFADGDDGVPAPLSESAIRAIPRWHFAMLNDLERNDAFATALERVVLPGSFVLDIG